MNEELIKNLTNLNISSESAEQISNAWLNYMYVDMLRGEIAGWTIFFCIVFGIRAIWEWFKKNN
jgi:hypothetical protein